MREGEILLDNINDNKIGIAYKNYLINIDNKEFTISEKIKFIYWNNTLFLWVKYLKHKCI